jgi:seryl-tRNA synthetase
MLTIKQIRENTELVITRLAVKGIRAESIIKDIIELDDKRKSIQQRLDDSLAEQNATAKLIGALLKEGKKDEAEAAKQKVAHFKESSRRLEIEPEQESRVLVVGHARVGIVETQLVAQAET